MQQGQRQLLHATLTRSSLQDIRELWPHKPDDFDYELLRAPETGMVMAVARAEHSGEPFNLGEVTVTRCAIRLKSGETGIAYVMGSDQEHALIIAMIDALAQQTVQTAHLFRQVINPLQEKLAMHKQQQQAKTSETRVDFLTLVRGED